MFHRSMFAIGVIAALLFANGASAKSLDEETPVLVQALAKQLVAKKKTKIAAIDFTDLQGRPNELGRFVAEQLSVDMVAAEGITVIDRANLNAIMAEHKLTAEGLVNPENAKKLGQFAGVDAILIGNLAALENTVVLTVKAVSTDTSEVVAAGRLKIDITEDIQRMLGQSVAAGNATNGGVTSSGDGAASAAEGEVIATRDVGPLNIVLRNVMPYSITSGTQKVPAIRCTFDFNNRGLQHSLAVAANQMVYESRARTEGINGRIKQPITGNLRGRAVDSSRSQWGISRSGLVGLAGIYCFETETDVYHKQGSYVTQANSGSVVEYVRHGVSYDGKGLDLESNPAGRYWAGSFTEIPPGKSARVTLDYVPDTYLQAQSSTDNRSSSRSTDQRQQPVITWPEFFQLDIELVVGTFTAGERPEKSKDLLLRNLTIDRVVLPKSGSQNQDK